MQTIIINKIFEILSYDNPQPRTELEFNDAFTAIIAIILSAQATDISVNIATKKLFNQYNSPNKFLELGEEALKPYIKNIGLYNNKAKNIIKLCTKLIENHNGIVPYDFEELIKLPGVGRKTANVFLNCIHSANVIGVDTHVFRTAKRIGISNANTVIQVEKELLERIPAKWLKYAHNWLVLHGRYICQARKPKCYECKLKNFCNYYQSIINDELS